MYSCSDFEVEMGRVPTRPFPEPILSSSVEQRNQDAIARAGKAEPAHDLPDPKVASSAVLAKSLKEYWAEGASM